MIKIKKQNPKSVRWIVKNTKYAWWRIAFLAACTIAISYISVRFAFVSKELLDKATSGKNLRQSVIELVFLIASQLAIQIGYTLVNLHTETAMKNRLQRQIFSSILHKKWLSVSKYHSGELLNRLNSDVNIITTNMMTVFPNLTAFVSRIVMGFGALYALDPRFSLIFLVVGPFVMIVARIYSKKIKPLHKNCQQSHGKIHSFMLETIQNIPVIKSFGVYKRVEDNAGELQKNYLKLIMKRGYLSIGANILFYISMTIGYYFAVVWCAYRIAAGIMTVGTFTAIVQLVSQVQTPFKELAGLVPQLYAMTASAERIMEMESLPDEERRYYDVDFESVYDNLKCIKADSISFAYDKEVIFSNASVTIEPSSLIVITGISGIGKSTLLKLILGILNPDSGEIRIELNNGQSYISDASMRNLFAYVPQGNMILSGTVRENITFMSQEVSEEKIIDAAKLACIYDVISDMPDGFDTLLGEGGCGLSEGQVQRLAVARAIYAGAPILLLDEATSALDEKTEQEMLINIKKSGKTCIIISHKECAVNMADKIITIDNGKISIK